MQITDITAYPISFPIPEERQVSLGIGQAIKRDAVVVKVETSEGITGWGESHAGRAPGAVAQLANSTLRTLVLGMDAFDTVGVWDHIYRMQLASHGMGAGCAIAMSGIDMALWDIRGKATGRPLCELLGGTAKSIAAYAGGVALGYQPPDQLVDEARAVIESGYWALKLRLGDTAADDIARVHAVRAALGDDIDILTDANTAYSNADVRRVMPVLDETNIGWLEEPFPAHDHRLYAQGARLGRTPLAALFRGRPVGPQPLPRRTVQLAGHRQRRRHGCPTHRPGTGRRDRRGHARSLPADRRPGLRLTHPIRRWPASAASS